MARDAARAAAVDAVIRRLAAEGVDGIWIDRAPVFDKTTLLHALYQALQLPAWFGFNWDALADVLNADETAAAAPVVLIFSDLALLEERDPDTATEFLDIVADAASNPVSPLRGLVRVDHAG